MVACRISWGVVSIIWASDNIGQKVAFDLLVLFARDFFFAPQPAKGGDQLRHGNDGQGQFCGPAAQGNDLARASQIMVDN